ncbi:hypothetical protein MVEN_02380800 [Mycena venus]|uniref:Ubiquitin-like domain-containing protein n=1 Tax=Mycena venus TaxID=2733690 RepID=A0A8H6X319_9AGAR|nr:hypothetical protein MVEN_02380800 [Mycena venus]
MSADHIYSSVTRCFSFAFNPSSSSQKMPLLAFALTYGSLGDIKETFAMACRLYKIIHDRRGSLDGIQKVLETLKSYIDDVAALMRLVETNSSPDVQKFVEMSFTELEWCRSHMDKLRARLVNQGVLAQIWLALSEERELASWRVEMAQHRDMFHTRLLSLLGVLSAENSQQVQRVGSHVQYIGSEVERVRSEVKQVGCEVGRVGSEVRDMIMATTARKISDTESNIMQRLTQLMNLHHISMATFSVTDPLGQPIPISLAHCADFESLDRILKACIFKRPEAGARYVERGDYNLFLPEGAIVRHVNFAQTVKPGMKLDMSVIKRPRPRYKHYREICPYCNEYNPRSTKNGWIYCSNHQCGHRYQMSAEQAEKIEEIYSPQLLTKRDETQAQEEKTDLFRIVEIQATYEAR